MVLSHLPPDMTIFLNLAVETALSINLIIFLSFDFPLLRNFCSLCTINFFLSSFFISFCLILTSSAYWLYVYRFIVAFDHNQ